MSYLKARGYIVHEIDCLTLQTIDAILNDVLHKLGNLPADFIYPRISGPHVSGAQFWGLLAPDVPEDTGMALAFKHFDAFHRADAGWAQSLVNMLAQHHFWLMRRGLRFMAAVHCEHKIELEPLVKVKARINRQKWNAAAIARFERVARNRRQVDAAHKQAAERHLGLKRRTFVAALQKTTGTDIIELDELDLSAQDIARLLQPYDFGAAMQREREIERNCLALDAAYRLLSERHPILPTPTFEAPFHRLYNPLREVLGTVGYAEIKELDLSTEEIVRLLQDYDFEDAARREEQRIRNRLAIQAARKRLEIKDQCVESGTSLPTRSMRPIYTALREITGAASNEAVE